MSYEFTPGTELQRGDITLYLQDSCNVPMNAFQVTYGLFYVDPGPPQQEIPIGGPTKLARTPANPAIGEYFAALHIPADARLGEYRVRWSVLDAQGGNPTEVVMSFCVVSLAINPVLYSNIEKQCIWDLRRHLRDQNPDKFYHFRPPEHEGRIGKFNRVFGQIWEDDELLLYLRNALNEWNAYAPRTPYFCDLDTLVAREPTSKPWIIYGAMYWALFALMINWISEEFDYSIGGISLSLERSSKYQAAKDQAQEGMQRGRETKLETFKFIRGLQQPRFGIGIRSAFGPAVGRGVLSPRSFL